MSKQNIYIDNTLTISNIVPETGVTLVEDGKIKSGGSDYTKIFGKLSLQDYERLKVKFIKNIFFIR